MTNEEIIKSIKSGNVEGVSALAEMYGTSIDGALLIAEVIAEHDRVDSISKGNLYKCDGFAITVWWWEREYCRFVSKSKSVSFKSDGTIYAAYGE